MRKIYARKKNSFISIAIHIKTMTVLNEVNRCVNNLSTLLPSIPPVRCFTQKTAVSIHHKEQNLHRIQYNFHVGVLLVTKMVQCPEGAKAADFLNGSKCPATFREDIPLKLNESLAERRRTERHRLLAIGLCIASVIVNALLCITAFVFASMRHSPATFAFAADCVLDLLSSLIVIWRYFGSPYTTCSYSREVKACTSLGVLFILAGVGVIAQGVYFLCAKETPSWYTVLIVLAGVGFFTCILLGVVKFILSKKMDSKPLFLDALNSILSALFAMTIIISDVAYLKNKDIWYLDPALSIIFSLGLLAFGIHTIIAHGRHDGYERSDN